MRYFIHYTAKLRETPNNLSVYLGKVKNAASLIKTGHIILNYLFSPLKYENNRDEKQQFIKSHNEDAEIPHKGFGRRVIIVSTVMWR